MSIFQVRLGSGNKDYHYTHWTILPDRHTEADLESLSSEPPIRYEKPDPEFFYTTPEEDQAIRFVQHICNFEMIGDFHVHFYPN